MPTPLEITDNIAFLYLVAQTQIAALDATDIYVEQADCDAMYATLASLMPDGDFWDADPDSEEGKMLSGVSVEFCRIQKAINIMLEREADPRTCVYMLPEWQALVKLDDSFDPDPKVRRAAMVELLRYRGGSNRAYWKSLVEGLGFTNVEINKPKSPFYIGDEVGGEIKGGKWFFTMEVVAKGGTPESHAALRKAIALRIHSTWYVSYQLSA